MKRWAVFDIPNWESSGGMGDFVGAFALKEEAELFIIRSFGSKLEICDMNEYLLQESPHIPTATEYNEKVEKHRKACEEYMKDPINQKMAELSRNIAKDLFYPDV